MEDTEIIAVTSENRERLSEILARKAVEALKKTQNP
jgi:hypothetical protein